jgi:ABC-type phosphate/phosphonate transport system ATPase subunit
LIMSTNGVMILGNSNSGKTTLLRIIEDAYHNIYKEEFDKRKSEYLGMKYEIFKIEDDSLMTPLQKE